MGAMALFAGRVHEKPKRVRGKNTDKTAGNKKRGRVEHGRDLKIKNFGRP